MRGFTITLQAKINIFLILRLQYFCATFPKLHIFPNFTAQCRALCTSNIDLDYNLPSSIRIQNGLTKNLFCCLISGILISLQFYYSTLIGSMFILVKFPIFLQRHKTFKHFLFIFQRIIFTFLVVIQRTTCNIKNLDSSFQSSMKNISKGFFNC